MFIAQAFRYKLLARQVRFLRWSAAPAVSRLLANGRGSIPRSAQLTSSLGIQTYFESKSLARFCCDFLNLQRLAESAFGHFVTAIEA
jgi:hypothetical protein